MTKKTKFLRKITCFAIFEILFKINQQNFLVSWVLTLNGEIYVLNFTPFASILSYFYMCGSGSVMGIPNTDPVPQSFQIRIQYLRMRIHNTGQEILVADSNSHNYPKSANSRLGECKSLEIPILLMTQCLTFCHCFPLTWFFNLCFLSFLFRIR